MACGIRRAMAFGQGTNGLRSTKVLLIYAEALERLYELMTSPPWNRPAPKTDNSGKTVVYICDLSDFGGYPFTTCVGRSRVPFIALPCRSSEPLADSALRKCSADAVHEAAHVFGFRERPPHKLSSEPWVWLDEGLAVFLERVVLPGNLDYLRFQMDWVDRPDESLHDLGAIYQSANFVRFLAQRFGLEFINRLWTQSDPQETPFDALERMLPESDRLHVLEPGHRDLFSDYTMDSYFLCDTASDCFSPEIWSRFGGRVISESFVLKEGDTVESPGILHQLACRYYRIFPGADVSQISVELASEGYTEMSSLKAQLAVVTPDRRRSWRRSLIPAEDCQAEQYLDLTIATDDIEGEIDHFVLVISNSSYRQLPVARKRQPAGIPYVIRLSAC